MKPHEMYDLQSQAMSREIRQEREHKEKLLEYLPLLKRSLRELNSVARYVDVDADLLQDLGKAIRELKKIRKNM